MPIFTRIEISHKSGDAAAHPARPEKLGNEYITRQHHPVGVGIRAERPILELDEFLVRIMAVPGHERFHHVAVGHDHAGGQNDLGHVVEVAIGDVVFQAEGRPQRDAERDHHGESREDRPRHEVGRENGRVPAGQDRDREVERHDRVHRHDQRRRQAGHQADTSCDSDASAAPTRASPSPGCRRYTGPSDSWTGRAGSPGRGSSPTYQNKSETVAYVETANTSQISGLRHCGQRPIVLG